MSMTKPDPTALGGRNLADAAPAERDAAIDNAAPPVSRLEQTVEAEDLRARLIDRGVQVSEDTSLDGLRELWATFGEQDPRADELAAEIERKRQNEETAEPDREYEGTREEEGEPQPDDVNDDGTPLDAEAARDALAEPADDDQETVAASAARAQKAAGHAKTDPGTTTLFDAGAYDDPALALPAIDGRPIDRIAVKFSGEVMLDRSNRDHVALWKRLKLGKEVELWVAAKGQGFTGKGATNKDGELDVIVGKRDVAVQTVRILNPEELDGAAREIVAQAREAAQTEHEQEQRELLEDGE